MILESIRNLKGATVLDLYEENPRYYFDVRKEQERLRENDLIVFQHPFYWYSMPPLLKAWIDEVFLAGFAYGENGTALHGKKLLLSITTGGALEAYSPTGYHGRPIQDFFAPYEQTAKLCGIEFLPPKIFFGSNRATEEFRREYSKNLLKYLEDLIHGAS